MFSSNPVNVQPTPFVHPTKYISNFRYSVMDFQAFHKITFNCSLFANDSTLIENKFITMEGDDYKAWGDDDNYLIEFLSSKLGLTIAIPEPVVEPEPEPVVESEPFVDPFAQQEPEPEPEPVVEPEPESEPVI